MRIRHMQPGKKNPSIRLVLFNLLLLFSLNAHAYVGPGMGAGTIGVILGILVSVLLAIFAIFWYPIKRLFKKKNKSGTDSANGNE